MSEAAKQTEEIEERIVRMEELLWFQEKKLDELDEIVRGIQQEQSLLIRQLEQTKRLTAHLRELLDVHNQAGQVADDPPPHYQQSK